MEIFICGINVQMTGKFLLILTTESLRNYLRKVKVIYYFEMVKNYVWVKVSCHLDQILTDLEDNIT